MRKDKKTDTTTNVIVPSYQANDRGVYKDNARYCLLQKEERGDRNRVRGI